MALTRSERGHLMMQIEEAYKGLNQGGPGLDLLETLSDRQLHEELDERQQELDEMWHALRDEGM